MQIGIMPFIVFPMLVISVGLLLIVYFSKKKMETDHDKQIPVLRKLKFSGQINKKSYLSLRTRLDREKHSSEQERVLIEMLREEKIDSFTYNRMKKALHMSLNRKLHAI